MHWYLTTGLMLGLLGALAGWSLILSRRLQRRLQALLAELRTSHADIQALLAASMQAGERLMEAERQLRNIRQRQDHMDMRTAGQRPYAEAIERVQRGAGLDELVGQCGLSQGEAELILMLHGQAHAG